MLFLHNNPSIITYALERSFRDWMRWWAGKNGLKVGRSKEEYIRGITIIIDDGNWSGKICKNCFAGLQMGGNYKMKNSQ
jgi:hypothetical protein